MRRRQTIVPILLAAVLALASLPAHAAQTFIVFFPTWSAGIDPARPSRVGEGAATTVGSDEETRRVEITVRAR